MARADDPFAGIDTELERFWTDLLLARFPLYAPMRCRAFTPPIDVFETDLTILVRLELAGAKPDDVRVTLLGQRLLVEGTRPEPAPHGGQYLRKEIRFGPFRALVDLGQPVQAESTRAGFEDGFLSIEMRKRAPAPDERIITITLTL